MISGKLFFGVSLYPSFGSFAKCSDCSLIIMLRNDKNWGWGGHRFHQSGTKTKQRVGLFNKNQENKIFYTYRVFHIL